MIPNLITAIRFILIGPILWALFHYKMHLAATMLLVATATDGLDGWAARRLNQESTLGAFLDLLADRCVMTPTLLSLFFLGFFDAPAKWLPLGPWMYLGPVVLGDFLILVGLGTYVIKSRTKKIEFPSPPFVGKQAYVWQCVTVVLMTFNFSFTPPAVIAGLIYFSLALTLATYVVYMKDGGHVFTD